MISNEKLVSIILLTYNNSRDLVECIPSLLSQTYNYFEIIVVDNASTDGTVEFIRENYPQLKLIETGKNLGYPGGNNIGFEHSRGDYIVIVNPDTLADPNWLSELIKPLEADSSIDVTVSKVLIYYEKNKINVCGTILHYTGLTFCKGLNALDIEYSTSEEIKGIPGCSFAIRKKMLDFVEGFDSDFFLYMEDADFSWRVCAAGGRIKYIPTSRIYHKFKLSVTSWKYFYLERNRYIMLLKNLDTKTLLLMLPGLIVTEIITIGHALLNGKQYLINKLRVYWWLINKTTFILEKRKKNRATKRIPDKEFIKCLEWKIPFEQVIKNKIIYRCADKLFNTFFKIHYKLICKLL